MKITILSLLLVSIIICNGQKSNGRRDDELECGSRRCCHTRQEFKDNKDGIINCKLLSDRECGLHDQYCIWNCNKFNNDMNEDGEENEDAFIRKFRGISNRKGKYKLPKHNKERRNRNVPSPESYNDFVRDSQWVSMDKCGVMYENELRPDIINNLYQNQLQYPEKSAVSNDTKSHEAKRRLQGIIGPDNRWETDSDDYPYSPVLYLQFETSEGTSRCTASMISDRWAITAAHCVYGDGDWYSNFKAFYNIQACSEIEWDTFVGDYYSWSTVWMLGAYASDDSSANDMAMIQLDEAPGLGYFGFGYDNGITSHQMDIISHPSDKDCDKMVQNNAVFNFNELDMVSYDADVSGGASGSSIRRSDTGKVYGVITSFTCGDTECTWSKGTNGARITSGRYSSLCERIGNGRC